MTNSMQTMQQERQNAGTTKTYSDDLERNGYYFVKDLCDPEELYHPVPRERGFIRYFGKIDRFDHSPEDPQVPGSLSRNGHPQYKKIHSKLRKKVEEVVGRNLSKSYYEDRYYFEGHSLKEYISNDACEISVVFHVSSNLEEPWPLWIKTPDSYVDEQKSAILVPGDECSIILQPGDGLIYKGCERPLWRDTLPVTKKKLFNFGSKKEFYYHELKFHYVLTDGQRSHLAQ